jgi:hypothetical protein
VAFPEQKLAIECMGAVFANGHHTRGQGYSDDCEKAALLAIHGWRYIPCTGQQVKRGEALQWIEAALRARK